MGAMVDAREARRQQILESQLTRMGFSLEESRRAVEAGPDAIAVLKASQPTAGTQHAAAAARPVEIPAAQQMGFSRLHIAAALDECRGDQSRALELLVSGWSPLLQSFDSTALAEQANTQRSEAPTLAREVSNSLRSKCCCLCQIDSEILPGIECRGDHFTCVGCFEDFVKNAPAHTDLRCPVRACTSDPWSYTVVAQHVPEEVFDGFLARKQHYRELAMKDRECKLREELEREVQRTRDEAAALALEQSQRLEREQAQAQKELTSLRAAQAEAQARQEALIPRYWSSNTPNPQRRWNIVQVTSREFQTLNAVVQLPSDHGLGGQDQRQRGAYSGFALAKAWRLENHHLFAKFSAEKQRVKSLLESGTVSEQLRRLSLRGSFAQIMNKLPGHLDRNLNEAYMLHGTKPETVLSVIANGLNERFSGGLFGQGTYFAEDISKNDQYVTVDKRFGDHPELHRELYGSLNLWHPKDVYYVFVCRVVAGQFCRTKDGETQLDADPTRSDAIRSPLGRIFGASAPTPASVWSSSKRELAGIPGTSPPEPYHGLLAETGGCIRRHREFVSFHGDRIYPEYLLAYHRV
jgi:hypothetical protein